MKRILLIAVILCAMFSISAYVVCIAAPGVLFGERVKGSGVIITRTMEAPAFEKIDASRAVKVVISESADKITVAADDNLMEYVVVKAKGNTLTVTMDKKANNISNSDITVTVPANGQITTLDASSAAQIRSEAVLNADKFSADASSASKIDVAVNATTCSLSASSAAKINADITTTSCTVEASSAAKIDLEGSAQECRIDLSSASKLSADDFAVVVCTVDTSSGAKARVNCTGRLRASASSGSSIRYSGDCATNIQKSSGGSVSRD